MKENWTYKKLGEVCEIYQPQTISTEMLVPDGEYLVYGANGIIGRYDKYNHAESEVLLTCRGATCGSINVSAPYSWINGNAMVIHPIDDSVFCSRSFLVYLMKSIDYSLVITGAAQPQITRQKLSPVKIAIPPIETQSRIVSELDLLQSIIDKQKAQLKELDNLAQAVFYDMFGDILNATSKYSLKDVASYSIGLTYKPTDVSDEGVIVLRSSNIQGNQLDFLDIVRVKTKIDKRKIVDDGDILMCSRNGSSRLVGKVARIKNLKEQMSFGAFMTIIKSQYNYYLFYFFLSQYFRSQLTASQTATINQITTKMLDGIKLNVPPLSLQQSFAAKIDSIEKQKAAIGKSIEETQKLFDSRMDYWFG